MFWGVGQQVAMLVNSAALDWQVLASRCPLSMVDTITSLLQPSEQGDRTDTKMV